LLGYTARAEILVHSNGVFATDEKLYEQIRLSRLDDLTLSVEMRNEIEENILNFFSSEDVYNRYKVPWKRGVLLTGPPGNGKTQTIKAVIAQTKLPCIYVRNFQSQRQTASVGISKVFKRARELAPCILVMEDLDSLIDRSCLSFLLNELDGFAENRGVLIVATSNYPEKLDPALTERPSRFDRKIKFDLPGPEERFEFLRTRSALHPEEMALDDRELFEIAQLTEGFTFAYLKELDLSATMRFSRAPMESAFGQCLRELVKPLKSQMKTDQKIPVATTNVD
jgi:ATP-dependent 26S proteasome regulatory subunit